MTEEITVKDLELTMVLRNNQLKERRGKLGFTQYQMADAIGIPRQLYARFECLTQSPLRGAGWSEAALAIANFFDVSPTVLWPDSILDVRSSTVVKRITAIDLRALLSEAPKNPEEALLAKERRALLTAAKEEVLTPRQRLVVEEHIERGDTLEAVARRGDYDKSLLQKAGVKALKKLRDALDEDDLT